MRVAFALLLLVCADLAHAQQRQRPAFERCDSKALAGRAYFICLERAALDTHTEMEALVKRIGDLIESRVDLAAAQKSRWKNSLEEAQILFVRLRNQECQAVAPFESVGRIGSFEQRLLCLVDKNLDRIRDLEFRYTK